MTLTQLAYLVAVDAHQHFGRAAESCNVTQPTLSMQLRKLERTLGVLLFDRSRVPVVPTEVGSLVIAQARVALREAARILDVRDAAAGIVAGELRLGVIPTLAPYLLPRVLPVLAHDYPQLELIIEERVTDDILDGLRRDTLDAGVVASPVTSPNLIERVLFSEPFVGYVSASHRLARRRSISAADLSLDDLWLLAEGHCFRTQTVQLCSERSARGGRPVGAASATRANVEVRVLDDAEHVAERIANRCDSNAPAHVLGRLVQLGANPEQAVKRFLNVGHAPVSRRPTLARRPFTVRIQPELEATHVEANVERLVKVRRGPDGARVPLLRLRDVRYMIDDSAQTQHIRHETVSRSVGFASSGHGRCTNCKSTVQRRYQMADNREQSAAWDSEKKLDTEEKSLIGDEAEDRNLTGSTTYVTLPDQGEQQSDQGSDQGSNKKSQKSGNNSGNNSGNKSSDSNRGDKRS